MILGHFRLNPIEVNAFIFGCPETKEAMLVDVGEWDPRLPQFVEDMGLKLTTIFITHDHADHVAGLPAAAKHFGATVTSGTEEPVGYNAARVVDRGAAVTPGQRSPITRAPSGPAPRGRGPAQYFSLA